MTTRILETGSGSVRFDDDTTHVMGVVNLSPESKNVDTIARTVDEARTMAGRYREAGATFIDLGAQSSHFDNPELEGEEEISRLLPALEALVADRHLVSVDTWKPEVARAAIEAGAAIINDTGGSSEEMVGVVSGQSVGLIAMYLEGRSPLDVGAMRFSGDKGVEMRHHLSAQLERLTGAGVRFPISDPGIGISYRSDYAAYTRQQVEVIRSLDLLRSLGPPVLVPVPRKAEPARVHAFIALSLEHRADIIRVHDVEVACDLVDLFGRAA
ncbi:MAG: dihydropteroate synthase [Acidimicrobiia bacterium]|nr:MAG: dihydropteroate synthase [Acidimicrobiia bacterium]